MPLRGIVFDKDGTLFDFSASWSAWADGMLRELAADLGVAPGRPAAAIGYDPVSGRFRPDSVVIAGTAAEVTEALLPVLPGVGRAALLARINTAAASAPMVPVLPLAPFLGRLRARGLALGLATNDSEAPARAHLAAHGCADAFDFIAGYDSGHGGKPAPGQLLAFAHAMRLPPGSVAMIGDSTHDLAAARSAGMRGVAVLTGLAGADELGPLAEVVLPSIAALEEWLDRQP